MEIQFCKYGMVSGHCHQRQECNQIADDSHFGMKKISKSSKTMYSSLWSNEENSNPGTTGLSHCILFYTQNCTALHTSVYFLCFSPSLENPTTRMWLVSVAGLAEVLLTAALNKEPLALCCVWISGICPKCQLNSSWPYNRCFHLIFQSHRW